MRHRTRTSHWLMLCAFALALALSVAPAAAQEAPVIRVGVIDQVRGSAANGARLAIQQINDAGGLPDANGTLFRLALDIQPLTLGQPADAAILALDQADLVAVIGPADNRLVVETLDALQSLDVPVLIPATGDTLVAADTTGSIFRVRAAEVWQGRALADYLISGLGLTRIATVQLDIDSLPGVIGFSTAATALGVAANPALTLEDDTAVVELLQQVLVSNPDALVAYGAPGAVAELYTVLRGAGWQGLFAYPQAQNALFANSVAFELLPGIISTTTWPFTAVDQASVTFLADYVRAYGEVPDEVAAAGYDAVRLIAAALLEPGDLRANITRLDNVNGIQGLLRPADFAQGDTISDVAVVELGRFGAPEVLARYRDGERLPPDTPAQPQLPAFEPTATPEGVVITIRSERQNVRSGPGLVYPILGELLRDQQARVIATLPDRTWVVIDFAGMQGWLATYLLDVFGDLGTVPIAQPPPTPTPNVTPTPVAPPEADIIIDAVAINPQPIQPGAAFVAVVNLRNAGNIPAGSFVVGATFPPSNTFASAVVGGLGPGETMVVNLQASVFNTGFYTASIVADINNQVPEGVAGESNNFFPVSYVVDVPLRAQGSQTLHLGDTIDLEQDAVQGDANWNGDGGVGLKAIFGARLGLLPGSDLNLIHWEVINPAVVNRDQIARGELNPGTIIGIITADGNRAAMRVEAVSDTDLTVSYKTYSR